MSFSPEFLLMIAITGMYLYDSAQLLCCNEALLLPGRRSKWIVVFGSENTTILGKEIYIPNPLQIHRPLFRLSWEFEISREVFEPWEPPRQMFYPLAPFVWSMAIALFLLFPLGFFTRLGESILLPALLLLYGSILVAMTWVWFHRTDFYLSRRGFAALAFESLICPPFALNLIRHLAAAVPVREDLVSAARRLQSSANWLRTRTELIERLRNEIQCEDTDSERYGLLHRRWQLLIDEEVSCQP
ncbi:MAG: hypothetical protein RKP46_18440 [Candidatus Accumulibacter sp.]|uniref:hypothetical protein n=1 Tax=Accumulibacter sp. TaxID=2053492 RepID=UPI00287B3C37|nr:hypothetical protein [Accumulibacter sp.]MDS4016314.1 hypothetical protein [Accumulibacter sp.]